MRLADKTSVELLARAKAGDKWAMEDLVEAHADLINAVVVQNAVPGHHEDDRRAECLVAFVRAVRTFDPKKATWRTYVNRVLQRAMIDLWRAAKSIKGRGALSNKEFDDATDDNGDDSIDAQAALEEADALDERIHAAVALQVRGVRSRSTVHVMLLLNFISETIPSLFQSVVACCEHGEAQPTLFPEVYYGGSCRPLGDVVDEATRMLEFFERLVLRELADGYSRQEIGTRLGVSKALVDFVVTRVREDMEAENRAS